MLMSPPYGNTSAAPGHPGRPGGTLGVPCLLGHDMGLAHHLAEELQALGHHVLEGGGAHLLGGDHAALLEDRKSTRLNSSHLVISYAVFCLKKKNVHSHGLDH